MEMLTKYYYPVLFHAKHQLFETEHVVFFWEVVVEYYFEHWCPTSVPIYTIYTK